MSREHDLLDGESVSPGAPSCPSLIPSFECLMLDIYANLAVLDRWVFIIFEEERLGFICTTDYQINKMAWSLGEITN
jgi:hypothetical protein